LRIFPTLAAASLITAAAIAPAMALDISGAGATWPVTAATFVLVHKQPKEPAVARAALKFFSWAFAKGGKLAEELDYVPIPGKVVGAIEKVWASEIKDASGKPVFTAAN
jgi:phosphate transport system substrate-binding protein